MFCLSYNSACKQFNGSCEIAHCVAVVADAFTSIQNVRSYSPQLYSTITTDAALLKVIT